jgi:hypothetical protein
MRGARAAALFGVFVGFVSLGAVRCTYAPDFPSGTLKCSETDHLCPDGYQCVTSSNTCYKTSEVTGTSGSGGGAAGTGGTAGAGGAAGTGGAAGAGGAKGPPCAGTCSIKIEATLTNANPPSPDSKFVGHWVYAAGSTETVTCTDGSTKDNDLAGDYVDITLTSGNLVGNYFCAWNLITGPAGNATIIKPGQACSRNVTDAKTGVTKFTWHGTTFTFSIPDDKAPQSGKLSSTIGVEYIDDPNKTGCSL